MTNVAHGGGERERLAPGPGAEIDHPLAPLGLRREGDRLAAGILYLDLAARELRAAIAIWQDAGSRINAAHAQLRLAEMLGRFGEIEEAELELSAARKAFAKMDATQMVARCDTTRRQWSTLAKRA